VLELAVAALALLDRIQDAAALLQQVEEEGPDAAPAHAALPHVPQQQQALDPSAILRAAINRLSVAGQYLYFCTSKARKLSTSASVSSASKVFVLLYW